MNKQSKKKLTSYIKVYHEKQGMKKALQIQKEAIEEKITIIDSCDWPQDETERTQTLKKLRKQGTELELKFLDTKSITDTCETVLATVESYYGKETYDMFFRTYFEKASRAKVSYENNGLDEGDLSRGIKKCATFFLEMMEEIYNKGRDNNENNRCNKEINGMACSISDTQEKSN